MDWIRAAVETLETRRLLALTAGFTGTYTQSFDSLINSGTPPTIASSNLGPIDLSDSGYTAAGYSGTETRDGWAFLRTAGSGTGTNGNALFTIDDGSSTAGSVYSYGTAGSTERALGSLASGTRIHAFGVTLVNNTPNTITDFVVTYDGEQWRRGTNIANTLTFHYKVNGAINDPLAGFTAVPALNFTSPSTANSAVATNGNDPSFRTAGITATISGVSWAAGQTLVLRWDDTDNSGNDDGIAVDNVSVALPNLNTPGSLFFTNASQTVDEGVGTTNVQVVRAGGTAGAVSVTYTISDGTATLGSDYNASPTTGVLNFANGQASANIPISIIDDTAIENSETINLTLSNPTGGATLGAQTSSTVVIHDNDGVQPTGLLLNEVVPNPAGTDNPQEYLEVKGTPGGSLNDVYLVSVEGDAASNPGNITALFNLSDHALGNNGLAMVEAPDSPYSPDPDTTVLTDTQLDNTNGILQNGANSFLVIYSKTTPITTSDLDTNNDGTLDLPAGAVVLDGVGWTTGVAGDIAYGAVLPPLPARDSTSTPTIQAAATRDPNNTTPLAASAWFSGVVNADRTYDVSRSTLNTPSGEAFTPGAPNLAAVASPGVFAFGSTSYLVDENAGTITIPVYRFGGSAGAVSVDYNSNDGSAQNGSDYTNGSGTLNFADGVQTANLVITIVNDNVAELPENFTVALSNPTNGAILNNTATPRTTATVNINDDDVVAPSGVLLNEISVNPPGTDQPNEFVEIEGPASSQLNKVYFVSVEGDPGAANPGLATAVFNLTGVSFGSNGLILLDGQTSTFSPDGATTVIQNQLFDTQSVLQNGSNSFLVVFSPTPIATNTDLDTNNDGTLDLPSGATVLDGVGWLDPATPGGTSYGATLSLPGAPTTPPQAASRILGDTTPNSASSWYFGKLTSITTYDPANSSANLPSGAALTPGNSNFAVTDTTPPTVTGTFDFDAPRQQFTLQFSEPVQDITAADITLTQLPVTTIPSANIIITHPQPDRIVLQFQNYPFNALPDGNYNLLLHKDNVKDLAGNALAQDFSMGFFSYAADANRDMKVNAMDFNALASNFGSTGPFSKGDFNYDGTVNTLDFNELASRFNQTLPLLPAAPVALGSLFSSAAVDDKDAVTGILD